MKNSKKIASKYGYKLVDHKLELYGVKVDKKNEPKKYLQNVLPNERYDTNRIIDTVKKLDPPKLRISMIQIVFTKYLP